MSLTPDNYRFRKPVDFNQYNVLLVKDNGIWCIDSATWDFNEARQMLNNAKQEYGTTRAMLITSPSDDERVIAKIVAACNHMGRKH